MRFSKFRVSLARNNIFDASYCTQLYVPVRQTSRLLYLTKVEKNLVRQLYMASTFFLSFFASGCTICLQFIRRRTPPPPVILPTPPPFWVQAAASTSALASCLISKPSEMRVQKWVSLLSSHYSEQSTHWSDEYYLFYTCYFYFSGNTFSKISPAAGSTFSRFSPVAGCTLSKFSPAAGNTFSRFSPAAICTFQNFRLRRAKDNSIINSLVLGVA